jgi:hypothetical protein
MILALSGRRIDAVDAKQVRFPLHNVEGVRLAVRRVLIGSGASWLVSSAACGADLIALSEAGQLGIRRRIVLPFDREKFRESSVVDRPGDWGQLYDGIMGEVGATGDIVIVNVKDGEDAFRATCREILDEATAIGKERHQDVGAVMVWDGNVRETPDYTAEFGEEARAQGMSVFEVSTT